MKIGRQQKNINIIYKLSHGHWTHYFDPSVLGCLLRLLLLLLLYVRVYCYTYFWIDGRLTVSGKSVGRIMHDAAIIVADTLVVDHGTLSFFEIIFSA